jgi:hypothetical protein
MNALARYRELLEEYWVLLDQNRGGDLPGLVQEMDRLWRNMGPDREVPVSEEQEAAVRIAAWLYYKRVNDQQGDPSYRS